MQQPNYGQGHGESTTVPVHLGTNFISIEDFMKEQDQLDAVKSAELKARAKAALANPYSHPNTKKIRKPPVDHEAAAAEARAIAEIGETNWTGRLIEYRNAHPDKEVKGLAHIETSYQASGITKFKCMVKILESQNELGDPTIFFTKKKDARQYASKKAIDWLIDNKFMPADGSVKFPKPVVQPGKNVIGPQVPGSSIPRQSKGMTFAGQVPELCIKLGFNSPKYEIEKISEITPLYRGYAHFQGDPRIVESKIGEVRDVFGQKNAKELIAQEVVSFLKDIERQRAEANDEEDKKRKRSLHSPELTGSKEKSAKVD